MKEQDIWRDAYLLYQMYSDKGLDQDAPGIFLMALTACQTLIRHYEHPLAYRLTMALVDYYIDLWELAHNSSQLRLKRDCPDCNGCKYNLIHDSLGGECITAMDKEIRKTRLIFP